MPVPTPDEFWQSLVAVRLLDAETARRLRAECPAAGVDAVKAAAAWLVDRGILTPWQARRLAAGDRGPFMLGDYRLLERHDRDGEGPVFTARHEPSGRLVTLVPLSPRRCRDGTAWTAILKRTQAAIAARDPMLASTWSLERQDGSRFIVCETVAGTNLADEVERLGPLPAREAGVLAVQVARAVAALHDLGAVHGALSLDALRREPPPPAGGERHGRVRLLQFPQADDPHLTPPRAQVATEAAVERLGRRAAFVAPELLEQDAVCDARSDVYAVGAIVHALLVGRPPCWTGTARSTLERAAREGPEPLPATVPPALARVVGTMLASDPARRPATAAVAADALARVMGFEQRAAAVPSVGSAPNASEVPAIGSVTPRLAARRRARWRSWPGGIAATLIAAAAVGFVLVRMMSDEKPRLGEMRPAPSAPANEGVAEVVALVESPPAAAAREPAPSPGPSARQTLVDDPMLPWASPTEGPPPTFAYLPAGSQLVLRVRLADLAATGEGGLFLKSLGPAAEHALAVLLALCGGDAEAIDVVQAGWQAGGLDEVMGGYAVWFREGHTPPVDDATRRAAWGPTNAETIVGETVHQSATHSFWMPAAEKGRVLVIVPRSATGTAGTVPPPSGDVDEPPIAAVIREAATFAADDSGGVRAVLPGDLETLVSMLDADRHITLLGSPHYLLNTGRVVLAGPLAKLADPIDALFGGSIQAAAVSLHFGDSSYVELDAVASPEEPAKRLAPALLGRVEGLADTVEAYCTTLDPDPYGRKLVFRLPAMLRVLAAQARGGPEGRGVVLNAYLPPHAPHNIALASEIALAQTSGPVTPAAATAAPPEPKGALGRLAKTMTLTFAKDNLERSIQMLSEETGVPMEILGGDLQLEGITKNQSFGLEEKDKTADEILRVILAKSNPDGKLVYIVQERDGEEWVLITTRAAVEKRGDPLPPAFAPKK
jgi:hypothetical protein